MTAGGWYHCSVKPVSRSAGRSAVAAAAYRLGDKLHDEALDQTHDYTRRSGVVTTYNLAPEGSPDWALDPEKLWNAAEAAERRKNSQVAREFELALPSAVSVEEREGIARAFSQELVDRYGVAVTAAVHEPSVRGDDRNHHAHILATTRSMEPAGLAKKTRILDDRKSGPQEILYLREYAADLMNEALERAGVDERVDHRSFEARGIDREPTEHLGPTASEIERRGEESERGDRNREIAERNFEMDRLVGELAEIDAEIGREQQERIFGEDFADADSYRIGPVIQDDIAEVTATTEETWSPSAADVQTAVEPAIDAVEVSGQTSARASWWGGLRTAFTHYREATVGYFRQVRDSWRGYVESERGDRNDRDSPPERDDPPEQSR